MHIALAQGQLWLKPQCEEVTMKREAAVDNERMRPARNGRHRDSRGVQRREIDNECSDIDEFEQTMKYSEYKQQTL
eukprot:3981971-Amphidinium_carterae.1